MNGPGAEARAARDEGIERAADHANRKAPSWTDHAYTALVAYAAFSRDTGKRFTAEDVRDYAHGKCGIPEPPHLRAWGAVFQRGARNRLIEKVGTTEARAKRVHCAIIAVWRAV